MRTFHIGGIHTKDDITLGLPRVVELFEARRPKVGLAPEDILEQSGKDAVADYLLRGASGLPPERTLDDKHVSRPRAGCCRECAVVQFGGHDPGARHDRQPAGVRGSERGSAPGASR